ncbi:MAG: hypothetical protein LBC72_03800, partial [Spirochaetaceae bacterium]|nr:hypothetical protein [Spirochaetaceae bacterium]
MRQAKPRYSRGGGLPRAATAGICGALLMLAWALCSGCAEKTDAVFPFIDADGSALLLTTRAKAAAAGG